VKIYFCDFRLPEAPPEALPAPWKHPSLVITLWVKLTNNRASGLVNHSKDSVQNQLGRLNLLQTVTSV